MSEQYIDSTMHGATIKKTHTLRSKTFLEYRAVYEIMWKNAVEPDRPQMLILRMSMACLIPKATHTHS